MLEFPPDRRRGASRQARKLRRAVSVKKMSAACQGCLKIGHSRTRSSIAIPPAAHLLNKFFSPISHRCNDPLPTSNE
jgi:hypothetical protein